MLADVAARAMADLAADIAKEFAVVVGVADDVVVEVFLGLQSLSLA